MSHPIILKTSLFMDRIGSAVFNKIKNFILLIGEMTVFGFESLKLLFTQPYR